MAGATKLSANGLNLIARFEGYVGRPYNDAVGYATVGYGHLIGRRAVTSADRAKYADWTHADFLRLLRQDATRFERAVNGIGVTLTQGQFDALCSLAFNCGEGSLQGSIRAYAKSGQIHRIPSVMRQYVRAAGQVLQGLVNRREQEIKVFHSGEPIQDDGMSHLTATERRWCREYDRLKAAGTNLRRRRVLRRVMTDQRKRIWRAAERDGHGDVKAGMKLHHRQARYHSLLARTS